VRIFVGPVLVETEEAVYHSTAEQQGEKGVTNGAYQGSVVNRDRHVFDRALAKWTRRSHPGSCSESGRNNDHILSDRRLQLSWLVKVLHPT
jgi:hypothetical protein